jgi:NAD(P)H-dependent flavin oxidoreductase YrpB (nitropropane dioxygenase family)
MNDLVIGNMRASLPIIQGGMGVAISLSGLSSAVANEGGIGVISAAGIGMTEPDYVKNYHEANKRALRKEIRKARSLTGGLIGVNIMIALTDHEELIKTAIHEKADIIIMGAGLPLKIPGMIAAAGYSDTNTKLAIKVSSAKAAKLIFQYWTNKYNTVPDAVVVEGPLAGGHLGFKKEELSGEGEEGALSRLVKETIQVISPYESLFSREIPVIAAGGIYTGKDIFDIMQAGAKGVKLGSRFVATYECDASPLFKESYIKCKKHDLTIIDSPVGLPGRAVNNNFIEHVRMGHNHPYKCVWNCLSSCNFREAPYCIAQALFNAAAGKMRHGFAFAGANAYRINEIRKVSEIISELVGGYEEEASAFQKSEAASGELLKAAS